MSQNSRTVDKIQQFITASRRATWQRRVYALLKVLALAIVSVAVLMVFMMPSLEPKRAMPVGRFGDNPFGLYDVLGNVWEWTQECLTRERTITDSSARARYSDKWCFARGGSWDNHEAWKVCPSYPLVLAESHRAPTVGLRVAREVDDVELREKVKQVVRDCNECPQMVILEGGNFEAREPLSDMEGCVSEPTRTQVTIKPLAIGQYEVTVEEWNAFKDRGASASEMRTNRRRPIISVSWKEAQEYVAWLTSHTRKQYRLPSGDEWEYAARGDQNTHRWWGNELGRGKANCTACGMTWEQFFDWFGLLPIKDKLTDYKDKNE